MNEFVQLWVYLSSMPLFGLTSTLVTYAVVASIHQRLGGPVWANPVFWSIVVLGSVLLGSGTSYPAYFAGAQFVHVMLGPAVVAMGWPLWQRRAQIRRLAPALLLAAIAGGAAAAGSAWVLGRMLGLPGDVLLSLVPKSVTAPVAMGIADRIGGVPALSAVFAVLTGLAGALSGRYLFRMLGVGEMEARGFALGTAAHGIGAARAIQVDEEAGAYAGIALGMQALLAALLIPLVIRLIGG